MILQIGIHANFTYKDIYLYYNAGKTSVCLFVCLSVCLLTNSSEALGRIDFILRGNIKLIPGSNLIFFS